MVLGFHFIFSAYGFWLPNDPRGSWSDTVREFDLLRFGPARKADTTHSVAGRPHDYHKRIQAKRALRYPPVRFNGRQARAIVNGFSRVVLRQGYTIHALAVPPDHVHLLMRRHATDVDRIATQFKARATAKLNEEGRHPLARYARANNSLPSPWARKHWCPFIRSVKHMRTAIRYVERNPTNAGYKPQRWRLVKTYEG